MVGRYAMALSDKRLTARHSALTDAAAMIASHDAGTWESDPEFYKMLMEERRKVAVFLENKAEKLVGHRKLLDFECD